MITDNDEIDDMTDNAIKFYGGLDTAYNRTRDRFLTGRILGIVYMISLVVVGWWVTLFFVIVGICCSMGLGAGLKHELARRVSQVSATERLT